jgi:predicted Zn-dependent protease
MSLNMSDDDARKLAAAAQEQFKQKDFEAALAAFSTLREVRPQNAHWADRYAQCKMQLSRWVQAQAAWQEVIARHGLSIGRVNSFARSFIKLRDYRAAHDVLTSARTQIEPNADFFLYLGIAALALSDRAEALGAAIFIAESVAENSEGTINTLCHNLQNLVKEGYGHDVVWLVDAVLPRIKNRERLLRLGVFATSAIALFDKKLAYASELLQLFPDRFHENFTYLVALLDTQKLDAAVAYANHFEKHHSSSERTRQENNALASLLNNIQARPKWGALLHDSIGTETFFSINLRLSALMVIKAYAEAITIAEQALSRHAEHPWFMSILARANEKLGKSDVAAELLTKALQREPKGISLQLQLADVQIRAGRLTQAAEIAGNLLASHPRLPAALSLLKRLGQPAPHLEERSLKSAGIEERRREMWLHAGDSGDIIYALAAVRRGGGGRFFLTSAAGTREPMTREKIAFLAPLLSAQSYVEHVAAWQGEPITRDFLIFRHHVVPDEDLATQQWQSVLEDVEPDIKTPWLSLPPRQKHGRPVFARSQRYRNPAWDALWLELKNASPDAIFVGTSEEFQEFGHGEHYFARDALELAHIINGASIFVGNQSFPYAIAEGLKVGRMLEVYPPSPNCIFPGALGLYG